MEEVMQVQPFLGKIGTLGCGWQQLQDSASLLQQHLTLAHRYLCWEEREVSPSSLAPMLLSNAQGALQGVFHLETFRSLCLRDTGFLTGSVMQRDFYTERFL